MNKLGSYVKERRKDLALSQEDMAKVIGITNVTLCNLENGKQVGSNTIRKLSAYFHISTRDIRNLMLIDEDN